MAGYDKLENLLREELDQLAEEGKLFDKNEYLNKINSASGDMASLNAIYDELCELPCDPEFKYVEPSEYEDILKESECNITDSYSEIDENYFHGAWLGRCIGCAMGQPVEGWTSENVIEWLTTAGGYPKRSYIPTVSGDRRNEGCATDEKITGMPPDDDIRYTVLGYKLMQQKGYDFDSFDVGNNWISSLPIRYVATAETHAYLNFINVDEFLPWGRPDGALELLKKAKVNTYKNPYREFIGAQIRIDGYAYVAAGMPLLASKLAFHDAYLSHTKNAIYGAMFFSAMISAAFVEKDIEKCFEIALSVVPKRSRFYEEMLLARDIAKNANSREDLIEKLVKNSKKYNWVHTINNAAICIGTIFYANGDFAEAVSLSIECGCDTDCNGATVGSFMGALLGEKNIPEYLKAPLNDTFSTGISQYENYSIKRFASECRDLRTKLNTSN